MIPKSLLSAAFVTAVLAPTRANATLFYSINNDANTLVTLDSDTGHVVTVGALSIDAEDFDLTLLNGNLYGVNTQVGDRADLYEINQSTGTASLLGRLSLSNNTNISHAEGLTDSNGGLVVSYTTELNPLTNQGASFSNHLGSLGLDGLVTLTNNLGSIDADALGTDNNGQIYATDFLPTTTSILYTIPDGVSFGVRNDSIATEDIDFTQDGDFFGLARHHNTGEHFLAQLSLSNGSIVQSIDLDLNADFSGLAVVPEPSSAVILFLGATPLAYRRRRSSRTHR